MKFVLRKAKNCLRLEYNCFVLILEILCIRHDMASAVSPSSAEYWQNLTITPADIEFLQTYLFEQETPLTSTELASTLVKERIRLEREEAKKRDKAKLYRPKDVYQVGDLLKFPIFRATGRVVAVRPGVNPDLGPFEVITVEMEDGQQRQFAAALENHKLNFVEVVEESDTQLDTEKIIQSFGAELAQKIEVAFSADPSLVRIASRWFPRSLLLDIHTGYLNLAEAILDMAGGEPLPTSALMKDLELPAGVNPKLVEFSLNHVLQEDERFDEVGPAGVVLWCLRRLEPEPVRQIPTLLSYSPIPYDRSVLSAQMLALESQVDDELSEAAVAPAIDEVVISLLYPHWRCGTLPVSARARALFPTAYESPRVRFTLVDEKTGKKMPGWVVRQHGYVYGLTEWYQAYNVMPGALIRVRKGKEAGEVRIEALTRRPMRDWVRTVIVGTDGGIVLALLKQQISVELNDRMSLAILDPAAVDMAREQTVKAQLPFDVLVKRMMRELAKLSPQGHVHVQELYAAVNILRRTPLAPLMALLATHAEFVHVGDLYYRLEE